MIVCSDCGTRNSPGTQFCGECGSFLEWEDKAPHTVAPAPVTTTRGGGATTTEPVEKSPSAFAEHPAGQQATGEPQAPAAGQQATGGPQAPGGQSAAEEKPRLVQPTEGRQRYLRVEDAPDAPALGEIACRACRAGNAAARKFCRACGTPLAAPVVAEKPPWWRRLWNTLTRRGGYAVGTRRAVRDRSRWLLPLVTAVVLALAVVAAWTVLPTRNYLDRAMTSVRDRTARHVPITPVELRASSSLRGTTPELVSDGLNNRFWSPSRGPAGQWLEAGFDRPVRLLELVVTPGIATDKDKFLTQGRPRDVTLTMTTEDGKTTTKAIVVQDQPGPQTFAVQLSDVVRVRLTIASGYGTQASTRCAIGELEFFIRG